MAELIGIVGLGRTGLPAAKAYLKNGYEVFGYDINPAALEAFASAGGTPLESPEEIGRHAAVIIVLVLNDGQLTEVIAGKKGILRGGRRDTTIVCMSTVNQYTVESLSGECVKRNTAFVDCPFTGGPGRIATGTLTLIAAAPPESLRRVKHILEVIGNIVHAGNEAGKGQAIKHCNQLLVGSTHAATMEVITLARKLGLDPALVTSVAGNGIAGSEYFRLLSESVLKKIPSPGGLGQMCKDMAIVKNTLHETGLHAHVAEAASLYFSAALRMGMSDCEGADLIKVVEQLAEKKTGPL